MFPELKARATAGKPESGEDFAVVPTDVSTRYGKLGKRMSTVCPPAVNVASDNRASGCKTVSLITCLPRLSRWRAKMIGGSCSRELLGRTWLNCRSASPEHRVDTCIAPRWE